MSLKGKHALITGSSRGIGRGIALKLAEHGVNVAVHYYQNEAAALDTLAQVRERGADGFVVQADVLDPKQITQMFGKVKAEFAKLAIFVSNARPEAATFFYPPMEITLEQWNAASDSQAKAFLLAVHEAVPLMDKGGRILAITHAQGKPYGRIATLGRHGFSQGRARISRTLLRGRSRQTRHHSECHQPRMDRGQCVELTARTGSGSHSKLARARMDSNGAAGNARRCRQCCAAILFGGSQLDHWASDRRRWRRVVDES